MDLRLSIDETILFTITSIPVCFLTNSMIILNKGWFYLLNNLLSNWCRSFCRALPSRSATGPLK